METPDTPAPMSLGSRIINVFAAPGELFSALAQSSFSLSNYLVPAFLVALMGVISTLVVFGQPAILQQVLDLQDKEMAKAIEKGKMNAQQAEQTREVMQKFGPVIMKAFGAAWQVGFALVAPLWWALIALLIAKMAFGAPLGFGRALEIATLSSLIVGLGLLVGAFIAAGTGKMMLGPHLGFLIQEFDMHSRIHLALLAVNLFSLWQVLVMSVGLSKLISKPLSSVAGVFMGVWVLYKGVAVAAGIFQLAA